MQFEIRTLSPDHRVVKLVVDATDEHDARAQVEALGLYATSIRPIRQLKGGKSGGGKFSLVLFSQELLALLSAGLAIVEGLEALLEKEGNDSARAVLQRLLTGLREGKRFSTVLSEQPHLFPPLYIGIVRAAEGTSDLPRSLARFISYQERVDAVRSKIVSAAIYPVILLVVGGAVSLFLICYVVPRFAEVYQTAGRSLPWMSQMLLEWGSFVSRNTREVLFGVVAFLIFGGLALRQLLSKLGFMRLLTHIPGVGERLKIYELSRLYLTLGMLLEGGIPIVSALETVLGIVSLDMRGRLQKATELIQSGESVSVAFESHQLCTPISLRMLRVGERSGELGSMLTQSATFYDGEITRWIDRFTRTFEPALMAAIGIVVGTIVVLLYMPIFDLAESLS